MLERIHEKMNQDFGPIPVRPQGEAGKLVSIKRGSALDQRRGKYPRRSRTGLTLLEFALVLILTTTVVTQLVNLSTEYARKRASQLDAKYLTDLALAGRGLVLSQTVTFATGTPVTLTPAQLETQGFLEAGRSGQSSTGREFTVTVYPRSANETVVLARAALRAGETAFGTTAEAGEGIARVGLVQNNATGFLRGPSMNYDLSWLTGGFAASRPAAGDLAAVNVVRRDQSVEPYLHRRQQALAPELNRMEADLDMGNFALNNVNTLSANQVDVRGTLNAARLVGVASVDGTLTVGTLNVTGTAAVNGSANVTGRVTAGSGTFNGSMNANFVQAPTATLTAVNAGRATVTGDFTATRTSADTVTANSLTTTNGSIAQLNSTTITARAFSSSTEANFENLRTGSCSGC